MGTTLSVANRRYACFADLPADARRRAWEAAWDGAPRIARRHAWAPFTQDHLEDMARDSVAPAVDWVARATPAGALTADEYVRWVEKATRVVARRRVLRERARLGGVRLVSADALTDSCGDSWQPSADAPMPSLFASEADARGVLLDVGVHPGWADVLVALAVHGLSHAWARGHLASEWHACLTETVLRKRVDRLRGDLRPCLSALRSGAHPGGGRLPDGHWAARAPSTPGRRRSAGARASPGPGSDSGSVVTSDPSPSMDRTYTGAGPDRPASQRRSRGSAMQAVQGKRAAAAFWLWWFGPAARRDATERISSRGRAAMRGRHRRQAAARWHRVRVQAVPRHSERG